VTQAALPLGVVIPALDAATTLSATLDSLRPAIAAGAEVIVVDGGSSDSTREIAESNHVRVERCAGGMYAALNHGFRAVQRAWLTWINADDLLYPDTLNDRIRAAGNAHVLYGPVDFVDPAGRFVHSWTSAAPGDLLPLYRAGYSPLLQQGTLFQRHMFEQLGGFNEAYRFVGDADFWWRALEAGFAFRRCVYPSLAAFRLHGGQLSQRYAARMRAEHGAMVRAHGGRRRTIRSLLALCRFRGRNLSSYAVRALRRRELEGCVRLPGSYDVVRRGE
jgi:glycosyltransferase involved in cell wall biosynthesis